MLRVASIVFFVLLLFGQPSEIVAQSKAEEGSIVMRGKIENGDTVLYGMLPEVYIFPKIDFRNARDFRRYQRLIRDLKRVYPYAQMAGAMLLEFYDEYSQMTSEREKDRYAKEVEEQLRQEFEEELKGLSIRQGRLLMKLIHRETGNTTYEIVQEFRGNFSAFFWQTLARLFGSNLKTGYDPQGEDYIIEQVLLLVKSGQI